MWGVLFKLYEPVNYQQRCFCLSKVRGRLWRQQGHLQWDSSDESSWETHFYGQCGRVNTVSSSNEINIRWKLDYVIVHQICLCMFLWSNIFSLLSYRYKVSWRLLSHERHVKLVSTFTWCVCVCVTFSTFPLWEDRMKRTMSCCKKKRVNVLLFDWLQCQSRTLRQQRQATRSLERPARRAVR